MKVLLDVNIVADICSRRKPFYSTVMKIIDWLEEKGISILVYTGSVQTMQYVLMAELQAYDTKEGCKKKSRSYYESEAKELLYQFTSDLIWCSALSEDGLVFNDADPEDAQLIKAVNRMGNDAVLLTRDKELLKRFDKAISPKQFLSEYAEKETSRQIPFCDLKKQLDKYRPEMELSPLVRITRVKNPAIFSGLQQPHSSLQGPLAVTETEVLSLQMTTLWQRRYGSMQIMDRQKGIITVRLV